MHAQLEGQHQVAEAVVGFGGTVLDEVAGNQRAVGAPVAGSVMIEDPLQGFRGNGVT